MKKVLAILSAGILALMAVSCFKEDEKAVFDPARITPPSLGSYAMEEEVITVNYVPAKIEVGFNEKMATRHTLALVALDGTEVSRSLTTSDDGSTLTLKKVNLSKALVALGKKEGETARIELAVRASIQDASKDNGINGFVDSQKHVGIASFLVEIPEQVGSPYEEYTEASAWSLIGAMAEYGISWDGDLNMWSDGNGNHVAAHVILKAGDEVKFRKDQSWDVNFGGTFANLGEEFVVTQGGDNIKIAADGVYDLFLNESGTAIVAAGYDPYPEFTQETNWTVIGALSKLGINWDGDVAMVSNGTVSAAFGVALGGDDEFKFRQDKAWTVNLGGEFGGLDTDFAVTQDGANIKIGTEGVYDLFVDPAASSAKVTAACGLKISTKIVPEEPAEEKPKAWSIIGTVGGSNWDNDIDLTNVEGDKWIARAVTVTASDEFKIRADHAWDLSYGGPEENAQSALGDYKVFKPEIGTAFEAKDKNIQIGVAGTYDVTLNYSADGSTILIEEHNAAYSIIGEINGDSWTKDFIMTEKDGIWTSPVVNITGGFKIRYDFSWADENCYGAESDDFVATPGTPFTAVQPGKNIKLAEAGDYKVVFNPATKEVTVNTVAFPEHLYMIGDEFGGWDWGSDGVVELTPVVYQPTWGADSDKSEAQFWAVRYISAGKGFKFCSQKAWSGDFWGLTTNEGFTEAGGNCTVDADGFYLIHIDLKREIVHVEPARVYGIGNCFGGWDSAMDDALFVADGKTLKATAKADGELRMYVESSISNSGWWTREFIILDGKIDYRGDDEGQGDQARVNVKNGQEIVLDFNAGTGEIKGEGQESPLPTTMYLIGAQFGNWSWDDAGVGEFVPVWGTQGKFWITRWFDHTKGFKFCAQKAWSGDFTGAGTAGYTVSDGNCWVAEDGFYTIYIDAADNTVEISPAEVYGIGDAWGANAWDFNATDPVKFVAEGQTMVATVTNNSEAVRLATKVVPSVATDGITGNGWFDWWKTEYVFFDGKIAYRGLGGDQERVAVTAGQKLTLDFNNGTATLSGGSSQTDWKTSATDLSTAGTANCYIVSAAGAYKFPAVKGNSNTSVGTVASALLLWETYNGSDVDVTQNSVIAEVDADASFVYIKTPDTLKPGNALVAAKDASGDILWSWHIWIPATAITDIEEAAFYSSKLMDRNLGALSAVKDAAEKPDMSTFGLYYQWGRKDPMFTKDWKRSASLDMAYSGNSDAGVSVTTEESIKTPTTYYYNSTSGTYNWNSSEVTDLWDDGTAKTVYDPCPAGYRVPKYDNTYAMWKYNVADGWTSDKENGWFKYGALTFPYAGYASGSSLNYSGVRSVIWSATYKDVERGWGIYIRSDKDPIYNYHSYYKPYLASVRCAVAE